MLKAQPTKTSKLYPRVIEPANAVMKLKTHLRAVDPHPWVGDRGSLHTKIDWQVTST